LHYVHSRNDPSTFFQLFDFLKALPKNQNSSDNPAKKLNLNHLENDFCPHCGEDLGPNNNPPTEF